jgi:S-DNA-T family DNA segregation ATPase FtsK/SpoIIIE
VDACAECGYAYAGLPRPALAPSIVSVAAQLAVRSDEAHESLRTRPAPDRWSPLEYLCHVRDVLVVLRGRVALTQVEDEPVFVSMRRDHLVVENAYNSQDPARVAAEVRAAAAALTDLLVLLDDTGWARTGLYNSPAPAVRDVDWIARHTLHELSHHLMDVDRGLGHGLRPLHG